MSATIAAAIRQVSTKLKDDSRAAMYMDDPVAWIQDRIGVTLWSIQKSIAESLAHHKKTAVKSCHSVGKTYLCALLICWWIDVHPSNDTVVVTTAPSDTQVKKIMWEYVRKIHMAYNLNGTVSEDAEWKSDERHIVGYGRKPADTKMSVIQGEHKKYTLVVIDEAGAVPNNIWIGADAITTMPTNRIMAIGNPDDPNTEFGNIFEKDHGYEDWNKFSISAFESPNFTDEKNDLPQEMLERLISQEWVEAQRKKWGEDSVLYKTRIMAQFPSESSDSLISAKLVQKARENAIMPASDMRPVLGVDIARFGKDKTVVISNLGGLIEIVDAWDKTDLVTTANKIDTIARERGATEVRIDGTGVGGGVVDILAKKDQQVYVVVEVNGSAASPDQKQWYNFRAYLYDTLRDLLHKGKLSLPESTETEDNADVLGDELRAQRYKFVRGAMLMESKDEMRRRGVKSPDFADALTYACMPFDADDPYSMYNDGDIIMADAEEFLDDYLLSPIAPV